MNKLHRAYIIALSLIAVFTISSQIFVQVFLYRQDDDARIINIAGRQRMLSQKIVKSILLLKQSTNNNTFVKQKQELQDNQNLWTVSHEGLQNGNSKLLIPKIKQSIDIKRLYQKISPFYTYIKNTSSKIISLHYKNKESINQTNIQEILKAEQVFLKLMNQIVFQYEKEAKQRIQSLRTIEIVLMFVTLLILVLEAMFIFRPMIKRIKVNLKKVETDNKERENELLFEIKQHNIELQQQQKKINTFNEKLKINQEVLKKSHFKLKASLQKNNEYLEQIEEQKKELEKSNQKLEINQDILKKSHFKLRKTLDKNLAYVNEIQVQKAELQEKHVELLSIEEELRQSNEFLEEAVNERTKELKEQSLNIEHLYKDLSASVNYARQIQQAILPKISLINASFPESFIFFRPLNIVSGDFYFYTETSYKKVIAAVDCTGHGIPGAFMSLIGNDLLYEIVKIKGITSPDKILLMLKEEIIRVLRQKETGNRDGMDLAICTIDSYPQELTEDLGVPCLQYAGVRNPLVLIQNKKMQIIKGDRMSIGGVEATFEDKTFTNHMIPLDTDTTFYIFSDGIQDQFGGKNNKKFSPKRLRNFLFENHQKSMDEQIRVLSNTLDNWQKEGKEEQVDDMLLIGVRV